MSEVDLPQRLERYGEGDNGITIKSIALTGDATNKLGTKLSFDVDKKKGDDKKKKKGDSFATTGS